MRWERWRPRFWLRGGAPDRGCCDRVDFSTPRPVVELPCGSESTSRTRNSEAARAAARLIEVVVFPTPPFWFAMESTRATGSFGRGGYELMLTRRAVESPTIAIGVRST